MINVFTIGVYNSTEKGFFEKLAKNHIDMFCDIRQRRGVRGSLYRYVNSNYLQAKLREFGINYMYIKELAPTSEIRQKQKDADKLNNETKKQRTSLGKVFIEEYNSQILSKFDMKELVTTLEKAGAINVVFFCVEEHASACHRSLVAKEINKLYGNNIIDL
jgi:predicted metalloendopeptidase